MDPPNNNQPPIPGPTKKNVRIAGFTNFGCGGLATNYWRPGNITELSDGFERLKPKPPWTVLAGGTNVLVSDRRLPGTLIHLPGPGQIKIEDTRVEATADSNWDLVVATTVANGLWGIELLSGIPGTAGAGAWINISAYGQSLADRLQAIEVFDCQTNQLEIHQINPSDWGYKDSPLARQKRPLIISKIYINLSRQPTTKLLYQTALDYASANNLNPDSLTERRQIIIETRRRAGSLQETDQAQTKTCGSFFKNPIVSPSMADQLSQFDENKLNLSAIKTMSRVHGRNQRRVSAAHVLLAAGFRRGQRFGPVRIHPDHVLKIENDQAADSQTIYNVARQIQARVFERLKVKLEFEVATIGDFNN